MHQGRCSKLGELTATKVSVSCATTSKSISRFVRSSVGLTMKTQKAAFLNAKDLDASAGPEGSL